MIIISLGGSIIVPKDIDSDFIQNFKALILKQVTQGKKFIIITGGGDTARNYQQASKDIADPSPEEIDWVGIAATKLNAEFLRVIFKEHAYEKIAENPTHKYETDKPIIIGSGWKPGFSTDFDAVLFAETYGAKKVINISNIDYVYDKDPKEFPDAKKIESITWDDFKKIVGEEWIPGKHAPFDPVATKKANELGLHVIIASKDIENLNNIIEEKEFKGTSIE